MQALFLFLLLSVARSQTITGYSQLRAFTGPQEDSVIGGYGADDSAAACGFILGPQPAGTVTGPSSDCQTRAGGVACGVQDFSGFFNLTVSSSTTRLFVGASFFAQYSSLPAAIYQMCDLTPPASRSPSTASKTSMLREARSKIAGKNSFPHVDFSPLAASDGTGAGIVTKVSSDSTQLAVGIQLFPYTTPRQAQAKITYCGSTQDFCDSCATPVVQNIDSSGAPLVLPYAGPPGTAGKTYCVSVSLTDSNGSSSLMGGAVLGDVQAVKQLLG